MSDKDRMDVLGEALGLTQRQEIKTFYCANYLNYLGSIGTTKQITVKNRKNKERSGLSCTLACE